jgi:hypothetical protein
MTDFLQQLRYRNEALFYSQNRVVLSDNCTKIANFQITHLL